MTLSDWFIRVRQTLLAAAVQSMVSGHLKTSQLAQIFHATSAQRKCDSVYFVSFEPHQMLKLNVGETWCLKYSSAACGRFDFKEEIAAANADETCKRREPIQKGYVSLRLASAPCSRTCGCDVLQVATDCRSSTVPAAGDIITLDRHTDTADRHLRGPSWKWNGNWTDQAVRLLFPPRSLCLKVCRGVQLALTAGCATDCMETCRLRCL